MKRKWKKWGCLFLVLVLGIAGGTGPPAAALTVTDLVKQAVDGRFCWTLQVRLDREGIPPEQRDAGNSCLLDLRLDLYTGELVPSAAPCSLPPSAYHSCCYILAAPLFLAASATALATAGPTRLSNALGIM